MSLADLHLAGWLARISWLAGAEASDDGKAAVKKVAQHIGGELTEESLVKLAGFWDAIKERASWKKVYAAGLH